MGKSSWAEWLLTNVRGRQLGARLLKPGIFALVYRFVEAAPCLQAPEAVVFGSHGQRVGNGALEV